MGALLNALEGKEADFLVAREPYERFKHLCVRIDRSVAIIDVRVDEEEIGPILVVSMTVGGKEEAIQLRIEPSRLLYSIDRPGFVEFLSESLTALALAVGEEEDESLYLPFRDAESEPVEATVPTKEPPSVFVADEYEGTLSRLRPALQGFLLSEGLLLVPDPRLLNSLLAAAEQNRGVDWRTREMLRSRMKFSSRRLLRRFGLEREKAKAGAERLLTWLRIQVPDDTAQ